MRYIPRVPSRTFTDVSRLLRRHGPLPAAFVPVGMARARATNSPTIEVVLGFLADYGSEIIFESASLHRRFSLRSDISMPDLEREVAARLPGAVLLMETRELSQWSHETVCRYWLRCIAKSGALPPGALEQIEAEHMLEELL